MPQISQQECRKWMLQAQGLLTPPRQPACKEDVLACIRRLSFLQIDTIHIVARSPYLQLFSRLGAYNPAWLDELLAEGKIFEYWAHAACYLPIEDYPYHRRLMLEKLRLPHYYNWYANNKEATDAILEYVRANGAVKSADFKRADEKKGTWWDWKIEKDALEFWFAAGEMMIARRERFQRVYDLRERVYPGWKDEGLPTLEETHQFLVRESIRALGAVRTDWVADHYRFSKAVTNQTIRQLLEADQIREISVEGWTLPVLVTPEIYEQIQSKFALPEPSLTTLLTPFDTLVCDRGRAKELFGFDFTIEFYLPAPKRKYGYFLVPLLHRGQIVARMDVKANRQEKVFEVKGIFWEEGFLPGQEDLAEIAAAIQRCANWHQTPKVVVHKSEPNYPLPFAD